MIDVSGGVVVAHHVVVQDDVALPRQCDTASDGGIELLVFQTAETPMAVRGNHGGKGSLFADGSEEVSAEKKAWVRFEDHFFDCVILVLGLVEKPQHEAASSRAKASTRR